MDTVLSWPNAASPPSAFTALLTRSCSPDGPLAQETASSVAGSNSRRFMTPPLVGVECQVSRVEGFAPRHSTLVPRSSVPGQRDEQRVRRGRAVAAGYRQRLDAGFPDAVHHR